jgi:predicted nucleic acid-binding protein
MLAEVFLDTNILVYAAYPKDDEEWKRTIAADLIASESYAISTQVMVEFVNSTTRKRKPPMALDTVATWLEDFRNAPVVAADDALIMDGLGFAQRYKIDFLNGLIVAAAQRAGAKTLYTEDLNDGQRYGAVTVINPFKQTRN